MSINRYLGSIVFLLLFSLASSSFISDAIFESHRSTGRSLLQTQKNCPINFEGQNYSIITDKCKGPKYPADICCKAFKEFACPFADDLNDLTNNCASTMFSYINLFGKYPPGIFANECKEGKNGLECDEKLTKAVSKDSKTNSAHTANILSPVVVILTTSLVFLFCLF
ncbi:GPI-anchored protein LLG1-like [Chenopodium quinoa]|uniref:GPI-anchored protein LLG1-like n=1 Tax=Chenopodium quinoa TaxID=63459 RepID=UPI000B77EAA9|nr:GPI-anchored protein LLG1-like [Chenopodium quinoa]